MKPVFTDENYSDIDINVLIKGLNNGSIEIHKCECKCPNHVVVTCEEDGVRVLHGEDLNVYSSFELKMSRAYLDEIFIDGEDGIPECGNCGHVFDDIEYTEICF